jgi:predicted polyphosphate/ATP-dependent NAD kinase
LQGNVVYGNSTSFFNLNNNRGSSTTTSANLAFPNTDCSTFTGEDCTIDIIIQGPGIPFQTIPCGTVSGEAVPVELASFNVTLNRNNAKLKWHTVSEINNEGFEIQRSYDSKTFRTLDFVKAKDSSDPQKYYTYEDKNYSNNSYYRLKQIDYGGNYEYSDII